MSPLNKQTKTSAEIDLYEASIVEGCTRWAAFVRHNVFNTERVEMTTLPDAIRAADAKVRETGRPCLIYAINASGRSVMVGSIRPGGQFVSAVRFDLPL